MPSANALGECSRAEKKTRCFRAFGVGRGVGVRGGERDCNAGVTFVVITCGYHKCRTMAFWGLEVTPDKPALLTIERRLVAKQAALLVDKASAEPCILTVSVRGIKQEYVVCQLHEGHTEHCTLEMPFSPNDYATLHLRGPHKVHLTGFLDMDDYDADVDEMDEELAASGKGRSDKSHTR